MNTTRSVVIPQRGWIALGLFALVLPCAAQADCRGAWDLSGPWNFTQSDGTKVHFDLQQTGDKISGTGTYSSQDDTGWPAGVGPGVGATFHSATVEGSINGSNFRFAAPWSRAPVDAHTGRASVGEYTGVVNAEGGISGGTYDKTLYPDDTTSHPEVTWQGNRPANCQAAAAQCVSGLVWRDNFDGDSLCVKPDERHRLADGTCRSGYVWRDSFNGDKVCVTPAQRTAAKAQKRRDELGELKNRPGAAAIVVKPPPAAPKQQMATAIDDVDIYKGPGVDPVIGMLEAKATVPVVGHEGGWYKLQVNVPGGLGWVAEDHLTLNP
jgi:hypothetical protein